MLLREDISLKRLLKAQNYLFSQRKLCIFNDFFNFDSGPHRSLLRVLKITCIQLQDINNVDTGYEVFSMTCQSDGLWKFDISGVEADPTSSPSSGTVSNTGAVVCLGCIVAPATAYCH